MTRTYREGSRVARRHTLLKAMNGKGGFLEDRKETMVKEDTCPSDFSDKISADEDGTKENHANKSEQEASMETLQQDDKKGTGPPWNHHCDPHMIHLDNGALRPI
jgi:hypothetical protein